MLRNIRLDHLTIGLSVRKVAWKVSSRGEFGRYYYLYSRCQRHRYLGCSRLAGYVKREQARGERESELRLVNSL